MSDQPKIVNRVDTAGMLGPLWVGGWLFTIGYLHLAVVKAIFAIVLWPYYIGVHFRPLG
jgi:hypothetical protein